MPLYLNQINTAILRLVTGDDAFRITTTLHPMPRESRLTHPTSPEAYKYCRRGFVWVPPVYLYEREGGESGAGYCDIRMCWVSIYRK